jgi:hypothetical protein
MKLSSAVHMASSLLDIHPTVPAISISSNITNRHSQVEVTLNGNSKVCRGGIVLSHISSLLKNTVSAMTNTFLDSLPQDLKKISPNKLKKQMKEFR